MPEKNPVLPPMPPPIVPAISKSPLAPTAKITHEDPNKTRYSDAELDEFRVIIENKLEEARHELTNLQAQLTAANEHGTDDTANTFKMLEDGSESLAKEEAGQLAGRQKKFIEQLENALIRIENKTYGICRVTGKLIPKERLRAVPHTTQSIEAKINQYRD
ncbi:MAG: TraR/DksA family transcriptional regulator [Bacteroidota bacterium]